ncbi:hypothetical protein ACFWAR_27900 [Streptomyces sp. NPDC059917]|uniref:hypothetical protein n=1 Tax=Streptomyces sp. NPDC059917 TaxID=3347002 RepID=UPI0036494533
MTDLELDEAFEAGAEDMLYRAVAYLRQHGEEEAAECLYAAERDASGDLISI